jgi:glycosyltransferase involved in cell wall biosynthesis
MPVQLNFIGDPNQTGIGYVRTHVLRGLDRAGCEVSLFLENPRNVSIDAQDDILLARKAYETAARYNPKAPCLRIDSSYEFARMVGKGLHVGFPFFELDAFDDRTRHVLSQMDLLLVASDWGKKVILKEIPGRPENTVAVIPLGVDRAVFAPRPVFNNLAQSAATKFFCAGKYEPRKAQDRLIEAFNLAFTPADNVLLVLNCDSVFFFPKEYNDQWHAAARATRMGGKIHFVEPRPATQAALAEWMLSVDCGVFPSRAEGWNLELLEMMACGKPVITTNYAAHTAFATPENSLLIDIDETEPWVQPASYPLYCGVGNLARLGPRQTDQLVAHLRAVHALKQNGQLSVNRAGIKTAEALTWDATAQKILVAIEAAVGKS